VRLVEGDVLDETALNAATAGQDVVYANLSGRLAEQARLIVEVMKENNCYPGEKEMKNAIVVIGAGAPDQSVRRLHGA
jgi:hypothetical protein